jgi:hypothetical protein
MALEIQEWLWDNIGWKIRNVYRSIKNVIRWLPVIWKDKDWDDWYIYTILETKLKHQAKYIGDRDWHTESKRDAERMMLCARLIQKIKEEEYDGEYMDYHISNYHWDDIEDDPDHKILRIEEVSNNFNDYFLKHPLEYKRVVTNLDNQIFKFKSIDDVQRIAMNISHNRQKRARKLLFTLLERNIERWWD